MCTFSFGGFIMKEEFMDLAFFYAKKAYEMNEVPIGAVVVKNDEVISYGFNCKERNRSVLEHAELIAIRDAELKLENWRLDECDLYVTLDPCPMCASAIKQARIKNVYSALGNTDEHNLELLNEIFKADSTNPEVHFISNLREDSSKKILNSFFQKQRVK